METKDESTCMIEKLKQRRFWGKLTICFKNGNIYGYVQEETLRPKNGGDNGNHNKQN